MRRKSANSQNVSGWLFTAPMIIILGLFLVVPIFMALWVSVSDWKGAGSPFSANVSFVGSKNYSQLLTQDGLARSDFMTSLRNNFFYVLFVVPLQTVLALVLAFTLNNERLKGKGFFRTAYYFPTVTSSVAVSAIFLFLFSSDGSVNAFLSFLGIKGPSWFADPRGLFHMALGGLGMDSPTALTGTDVLGLSLWEWISGPSVAMMAIIGLVVWTSAGGFMLLFLAGLQDIPKETTEAASIDGATRWQTIRFVIIPQLRPVLFLVLTLGLIGTWQVFDQIYIMSKGAPGKTTLTPAYLSYDSSFQNGEWGQGTAMAFILFGLIVVLTLLQRLIMRERDPRKSKPATIAPQPTATGIAA
ncbi:MAG: sugar ABC transporter permease [Propionibacteriaceae bacterium]|nr:sugar ABC transporter permease [Propionibacteriaceae bacterium]